MNYNEDKGIRQIFIKESNRQIIIQTQTSYDKKNSKELVNKQLIGDLFARNLQGESGITVSVLVCLFVCCGFTSHSAIFQLYSDRTVVQFPNFDLLPGTHAMGS